MSEIQLQITGMTCSACSTRIEKALRRVEGVQEATVSLATSSATVKWKGPEALADIIIDKIQQLGYGAKHHERTGENAFQAEAADLRNRFFVSFVLSLPLFVAMFGHVLQAFETIAPAVSVFVNPVFQMVPASILLLYVGYPFFLGAYRALRQGVPNMDVLVAMSITAAYFHSHYQVFHAPSHGEHGHQHYYFDSVAMILTTVTLGKWVEAIAKGNALRSLTSLYSLQAETARIIRHYGKEEQIPSSMVMPGDRIRIASGEWIPADGVIAEGTAEVDESLLTGESVAVIRRPGDRVYAGTRMTSGGFIIKAASSGTDTRLAQLISFVEDAQRVKPRIQRRVDRVAAYFVPGILALTALTFIGWSFLRTSGEAFDIAMAVLLVACPCALGLATPISILLGSSLAAKSGIVFKEGSILETLSQTDMFILDKTGTITYGKPVVSGVWAPHFPAMKMLRLAASLEQSSEHPFAVAMRREALAKRLLLPPAKDVQERIGQGITGLVEEHRVIIGQSQWLKEQGIDTPDAEAAGREYAESILHVGIDGKWAGALSFRDQVREDAKATIQRLSRYAELWMATGDQESAARHIASETGIGNMKSRMLPEQKFEMIVRHQKEGRVVAMVGDGVNDSAALAAADVGIAIAGGNDAALHAGDIVIIDGRISKVHDAYFIARRTMRNIKQNLGIAMIYNAVMIPMSMMGLLDPRMACIGMASSSLLVVGNALRLQYLRNK